MMNKIISIVDEEFQNHQGFTQNVDEEFIELETPEEIAKYFRSKGIEVPYKLSKHDKKFLVWTQDLEEYKMLNNSDYIPGKAEINKNKIGRYLVRTVRPSYKKGTLARWRKQVCMLLRIAFDEHERKAARKIELNFKLLKIYNQLKVKPKAVIKFFNKIKKYAAVKGTRFYIRYLHVSQYVDLDNYEIIKELDSYELEQALYSKSLVII